MPLESSNKTVDLDVFILKHCFCEIIMKFVISWFIFWQASLKSVAHKINQINAIHICRKFMYDSYTAIYNISYTSNILLKWINVY